MSDYDYLYKCPKCGWIGEYDEVVIYAWESWDSWGNEECCPVCYKNEEDMEYIFCEWIKKDG